MSSIYVLPSELLDLIISHLPYADFKSHRLTCHALSESAARWLFCRVVITYHQHDDSFDRVQGFFEEYAPLIRRLSLFYYEDCRPERIFESLSFFKRMPSLEQLWLYTLQALFTDDSVTGQFESLMFQASPLTPPTERILPQLRWLRIDNNGWYRKKYWYLDNLAVLFIIPTLEHLELEYLVLRDQDPKFPGSFDLNQRQTNLKSLIIENI
ncbi:uncharacterized protein KD926_007523 [Aspergillus affinis]|uniref:uncharacterized protein n=1 Tax=Aspergillus affinis TaxID=1070780 RepID=UPI0022FE05F4|nr:uncharacterized protein KD926_007523 [Aspergillus affinis]KAI9040982.1 hypothetical protein KD926_007523 [Aspergillus affinis]